MRVLAIGGIEDHVHASISLPQIVPLKRPATKQVSGPGFSRAVRAHEKDFSLLPQAPREAKRSAIQ